MGSLSCKGNLLKLTAIPEDLQGPKSFISRWHQGYVDTNAIDAYIKGGEPPEQWAIYA